MCNNIYIFFFMIWGYMPCSFKKHQKKNKQHLPTVHKGCHYRSLLSSIVESRFKGLCPLIENELCPRAIDNVFWASPCAIHPLSPLQLSVCPGEKSPHLLDVRSQGGMNVNVNVNVLQCTRVVRFNWKIKSNQMSHESWIFKNTLINKNK